MVLDFTNGEGRFLIDGACGQLQLGIMSSARAPDSVGASGIVTVVCHPHPLMGGTMNNKVVHTVARCHRDLGRRVVRFNFRGVEKSEGEYVEGVGEVDDLMAVLSWVRRVRPNDKIVLAGFSFGSYVVVQAASQLLVHEMALASLLLIAPAVVNYDFNGFTAFDIPLGVVFGDSDDVVEPAAMQKWFEQVSTEKKQLVLAGAGHFFHGQLVELKALVEQLAL